MIAVLVVLYFDKEVRRDLPARQRGWAIGSIGGFIGTGLLVPLLVLAGQIPDKPGLRSFMVIYTMAFLVGTFGIAITRWGREDAAQMRSLRRAATPPPLPPLPAASIREGASEREQAAAVLGAVAVLVTQVQPNIVINQLRRTGWEAERERLRSLSTQWYVQLPALYALSLGYPAAQVRKGVAQFVAATAQVFQHSDTLLSDEHARTDQQAQAVWRDEATTLAEAAILLLDAIGDSLQASDESSLNRRKVRPR